MTITDLADVDGRLGVVVAELSGDVLRLQRQIADLQAELSDLRTALAVEVRTGRVVIVADGAEKVVVGEPIPDLWGIRITSERDAEVHLLLGKSPNGGTEIEASCSAWMSDQVPFELIGERLTDLRTVAGTLRIDGERGP